MLHHLLPDPGLFPPIIAASKGIAPWAKEFSPGLRDWTQGAIAVGTVGAVITAVLIASGNKIGASRSLRRDKLEQIMDLLSELFQTGDNIRVAAGEKAVYEALKECQVLAVRIQTLCQLYFSHLDHFRDLLAVIVDEGMILISLGLFTPDETQEVRQLRIDLIAAINLMKDFIIPNSEMLIDAKRSWKEADEPAAVTAFLETHCHYRREESSPEA